MKSNLSLFSRPLFLLCLLLLLVNDFYFKYAFPGLITGKLSDFAGLFIFPYFFAVFFEKRIKTVYVATALYFTFWKLEISQSYIDWLSSMSHLPFYRTVDATDLIALLMLPVSYNYFRKEWSIPVKANPIFSMIIVMVSCFSFVATKTARNTDEINIDLKLEKTFVVPVSINELIEEYKTYSNTYGNSYFTIDEFETIVYAEVELKKYNPKETLVTLKRIVLYEVGGDTQTIRENNTKDMKKLTNEDFERYFGSYLNQKYHTVRAL